VDVSQKDYLSFGQHVETITREQRRKYMHMKSRCKEPVYVTIEMMAGCICCYNYRDSEKRPQLSK